jgi:hypothetical protein
VRRPLGIVAATLALAAVGLPAAGAADPPALRDTILTPAARSLQAATLDGAWGGAITATDGELVSIYFSQDYPEDPARQLQWADFMTSLVHGPELQSVTVLFTPLRRVQRQCGRQALACYSPASHTVVVPGDELPDGPTLQSILIHEYGHHIAASRANPPWDANDYGPKRWATALGVCQKSSSGQLFPGDEGSNYALNPAEVFAEDYRLLNEQKLGLPVSAWEIVDPSLEPDETVLAALEQDVVSPWQAATVTTYSGSFRKTASTRTRTFTIQAPLDGTLRASLAAPKTAKLRLLLNGRPAASATICGVRTVTATVKRLSGYGAFRLAVSTA